MATFYRNQVDLANALRGLIDSYWKSELGEEDFKSQIKDIVINNKSLLQKDGKYPRVIRMKLGIKRLGIIEEFFE